MQSAVELPAGAAGAGPGFPPTILSRAAKPTGCGSWPIFSGFILRQKRIQHVKDIAPRNGHGRGHQRHRMNWLLFDADDTLWENNIYFERAFDEFCEFLDHSSLRRPKFATC